MTQSDVKATLLARLRAGQGGVPQVSAPTAVLPGVPLGLWLAEQVEGPSDARHLVRVWDFDSEIVRARLASAIDRIVAAHPILSVCVSDGAAALAFVPSERVPSLVDVREAGAQEFASELFDFAEGPLVRFGFVTVEAGARLIVVAHHLVADATTMHLFGEQLAVAYSDPDCQLERAGYAPEAEADHRTALAYFGDRLAGYDPNFEPPRPDPDAAALTCGQAQIALDDTLSASLSDYATRHAVSVFEVLFAALHLVMMRLADSDDCVITVPVDTRTYGSEAQFGNFANLVPCRIAGDLSGTFAEHVGRVSERLRMDLAHRAAPFHRVVQEVGRDVGGRLSDLVFAWLSEPYPTLRLGSSLGMPGTLTTRVAQFPLQIEAGPVGDGLNLRAVFDSAVFRADTVQSVLTETVALLQTSISRIDVLTQDVLSRIQIAPVADMNMDEGRFAEPAADLGELLFGVPGGVLECDGLRWDRAEVDRRVAQAAAILGDAGVGPGTRVAIAFERRIELPIWMLAILKVGAAYVPLDTRLPTGEIQRLLAQAGAATVVCDGLAQVLSIEGLTLLSPEIVKAPQALPRPPVPVSDAQEAYLIFTSGSSGTPKPVSVPRRALANLLGAMAKRGGLSPGGRLLAGTTISFDIAALELLLPFATASTLVLASHAQAGNAFALAACFEATDIQVFQATPSGYQALLNAGWRGADDLTLWCGGEPLPAALAAKLLGCCGHLINLYGPTETTIWSTAGDVRDAPISAGEPLDNTRVYVLDRWSLPRPRGAAGNVAIGGLGVATGYDRQEARTVAAFVHDPHDPSRGRVFLTGDIGWRDGSDLTILGRRDDQVKIRGARVELSAIDAALTQLADVTGAAAVLDERSGHLMAGLTASGPLELDRIRSQLAETEQAHMVPDVLVQLAAIPTTANGKIDRKAVTALITMNLPKKQIVAPATQAEAKAVAIFQRQLRQEVVSADADYFALGGDSVSAVLLIAEIHASFGAAPGLAAFLRSKRSPQAVAAMLEDADQKVSLQLNILSEIEGMDAEQVSRELQR